MLCYVMRGNSTYRKHNIHCRQSPEQRKTKTLNKTNVVVTKTQNTKRNKKQTFIKGHMGVPPWNGQRHMPLAGLNQGYERST